MKMKRGKIIIILILMMISISLLVYSFAYTTTTHTSVDSSYLMISEISFGLNDSVESISLPEQIPTIDKFGLTNDAFSFSITNNGGSNEQYTLRLVDGESISTISNNEIRYQLTKNGVKEDIRTLSNSGIIDTGTMSKGATNEYSIVVWLNFDATTTSGTWDKVVKVEAGNVNIDNSGANAPILLDNMIPVYYDSDNDMWRKADRTNSNINYRWYDYDNRIWANAVTVYEDSKINYQTATEGTEVLLDDISMFYVWIPRFKYELFENNNSSQIINIDFEKGIENTGTMKCSVSNGKESCTGNNTSYTHPAFTFGDNELTGYWINKFELASHSDTNCYKENSDSPSSCNIDNLAIVSKPNVKPVHYITPLNLFKSIRKMEINDNIYGFVNTGTLLNEDGSIVDDNNNYDIHLSRNFEMSALTYLVYSKYGIYSDSRYSNNSNVLFSNESSSKTGLSYVNNESYEYNVDYYGTGASSTGNIYGVYDLNGKVEEYVMLMLNSDYINQNKMNMINTKYIDLYNENTFQYGDSFGEFKEFDGSLINHITTEKNMILRTSILSNNSVVGHILNADVSPYRGGRSVISIEQDIYITKW